MRKQNGDDVVDDRAVLEPVFLLECRKRAHVLEVPIEATRNEEGGGIERGDTVWDVGQRYRRAPRFLGWSFWGKRFRLYPQNILARKCAAAQPLKCLIKRC